MAVHRKFREEWEAGAGTCEACDKLIDAEDVVELGHGYYCPECADDDYGYSDHEERMAERRSMGLSGF